MARQAWLACPDQSGVTSVSPRDTGHQGMLHYRASCRPLVHSCAAHRSKLSCIAPPLGVSRLAVRHQSGSGAVAAPSSCARSRSRRGPPSRSWCQRSSLLSRAGAARLARSTAAPPRGSSSAGRRHLAHPARCRGCTGDALASLFPLRCTPLVVLRCPGPRGGRRRGTIRGAHRGGCGILLQRGSRSMGHPGAEKLRRAWDWCERPAPRPSPSTRRLVLAPRRVAMTAPETQQTQVEEVFNHRSWQEQANRSAIAG